MSTTQIIESYANVALAQFADLYEKVAEKKGLTAVPAQDLIAWMKDEMMIRDESYVPSSEDRPDPIKQVELAEPQQDEENAVEAEDKTCQKKVEVKDLKKLTYKQTRTIQKGEKQGEIIEEDVMFELPYLPHCVDYRKGCQAIRVNGGLMTPCLTRPSKGSLYCKACEKEGLKYGTIEGREKVPIGDYKVEVTGKDKTITKKEISYGTWLSKRGIERSFVEKLIADHGLELTIPESYYEVAKAKSKKRPVKKSPSVSSDGETSSVEEDNVSVSSEEPVQTKKEHALEVALNMSEGVTVVEEKKKKAGRPKKAKSPVDPDAPKKKRGRPKKGTKPFVDADTASEEVVEEAPKPVEEETPKQVEEAPKPDEEETPKQVEEAPKAGMNVTELTEPDEDGYRYFKYNEKSYIIDDENTVVLNGGEDIEIVGSWNVEENKPVFKPEYEP